MLLHMGTRKLPIIYSIKGPDSISGAKRLKVSCVPYHLARENQQLETARLLQEKGAYTGVPKFPNLSGKYIDSDLPEDTPKMFATGIVTLF